jgi:ribosomal protein S18 acetylase RimI-like enzyme
MPSIRLAVPEDAPAIWSILEPILRAGETYALPRNIGEAEAISFWCSPGIETYAIVEGAQILGTYFLRPNQAGGGDHVANCGYATAMGSQGRGLGRKMLEHSIARAKERGFRAMQFNFVVSTNRRAIATWKAYGFLEVGRLPDAFRHPKLGYVDALVMHRPL